MSGWSFRRGKPSNDPSTNATLSTGSGNYIQLKKQCLDSGKLWEDPDFPAVDSSLFFKEPPSCYPGIKWLRPSAIIANPQMFVGGADRMDVNQGVLGDCWLLAAVASLATRDELLKRVVPPDQSFQDDYGGVFRFQFWQYGSWMEVLVDDRLPTKNGKLIYMHSTDKNEFWSALLEKAFAKMNGSYEALSGGLTIDALTDFTGGLAAKHELRDKAPKDLYQVMLKAHTKGSLMGCSIDSSASQRESSLPSGLLVGHAYSITDVRTIDVKTARGASKVTMVRVRNPWGDSHEWKGAWSDNSDEWRTVPENEKKEMGLTYKFDGEFWMSFEDFVSNFQRLEICFLGPDSRSDDGDDLKGNIKWESTLQEGCWRSRVNAGGCLNNPQTFWTNPQYQVSVDDPDSGDEDGHGTIIVGLMQKNRRKMRKEGKDNLAIGYYIYSLKAPSKSTLDSTFFRSNKPCAKGPGFADIREASNSHKVPPGHYVIIPTTFNAGEEADFILRTFSERKGDQMKAMDHETVAHGEIKKDKFTPSTEEDKQRKAQIKDSFVKLAGKDGEIDAYELRDILNTTFPHTVYKIDEFSIDMARSMVAMRDADMTGKLGFEDFNNLWKDVTVCTKAFKMLDTDNSGYFNSYELRHALDSLGYRVSNATFAALAIRFSDKEGFIRFDDFLQCYIKLKSTFEAFKRKDTACKNAANFSLEEFLELSMYS